MRMDDIYTDGVEKMGEGEEDEEEEGDNRVYCVCQRPSHGTYLDRLLNTAYEWPILKIKGK